MAATVNIWIPLIILTAGLPLALGIALGGILTGKFMRRREERVIRNLHAAESGMQLLVSNTGRSREYWINRYISFQPKGDD